MYCVYLHHNKINNKNYIGITNDVKRRWRQNGAEYKSSVHFYEAILKYGFDAFDHIILEDNLSEEQAFNREKYYISLYQSDNKSKGYNISPGGNGGKVYIEHPRNMLGKHQTEHQKENQARLMSDNSFNPMKNGSCQWGVTHEHPKGMSGKKHSKEHNDNISKIMIDRNINCKPVKVIYPNGKIEIFRSTKDAEIIGLSKPVILKIIRNKSPYVIKIVNQYTEKIKHLSGIQIEYIDNTEITGTSNDVPVL